MVECWAAGIVICLERGADLHVAQLMPLPLTVSCFSKIQIGFTFLVPANLGSHGKRSVKRVLFCYLLTYLSIVAVSAVTVTSDNKDSPTQTIIIIVVVSVVAVLFLVTILLLIFYCRKRGQYKRYDNRLYSPASMRTDSTHTTHPFNGPFSRTTRVSRYQKGKTNLRTGSNEKE